MRRELVFDLETAPAQVYTWSLFRPIISIEQVIEPSRVICWAAKWRDSKKILFMSEYHDSREDMIRGIWDLLNEADVATGFNSDRFDLRHLGREFQLAGLGKPAPFAKVDLYKVAKREQEWLSNKLAFITGELGLSGKLSHHGFRLWRECLGDYGPERQKRAWDLMRKYAKRDVFTTDELRTELEPHIKLPHVALYGERLDGGLTCPEGHTHFQRRGYRYTATRRYPRYQCQECGRWFSENRSEGTVSTS